MAPTFFHHFYQKLIYNILYNLESIDTYIMVKWGKEPHIALISTVILSFCFIFGPQLATLYFVVLILVICFRITPSFIERIIYGTRILT